MRIINEVKPDIFIFENVKGLFSSNGGKDFTAVLRTIADIGLYECEWQLVNTKWVLPQNRERIYFIGHLRGKSKPRVFPFRENDFMVKKTFTEKGIRETIFSNKIASTLTPSSMVKLNLDTDYIIVHNTMLRRLTEIECERLQGFPDNWTQYGNYDGVVKKIPKSQRYKLLGNAVTVNIVQIIAERLK